MITFILLFTFLSVLPYFIAELLLYTFQPGRIFGFYGKSINQVKNEFWYNSLGGCTVCFTQRISEITYACLVYLYITTNGHWITSGMPLIANIILNIILAIGFTSIPFFLRSKKQVKQQQIEYDDQDAKPTITH